MTRSFVGLLPHQQLEPEFLNILKFQLKALGKVYFSDGIPKQTALPLTAVRRCVTLLERQLECLRIPKERYMYLFKRKVVFSPP